MIRESEIGRLVKLLDFRDVFLYHACQWTDFLSYVRLGGIPSRAALSTSRQDFTAFTSDSADQSNGVWDKVFANLTDFGDIFAYGSRGVPTVYGSIQLCIWPEALLPATDVAVCLRSAGVWNFDREREALPFADDVNELFEYPLGSQFPWSRQIKTRKRLGDDFSHTRYVANPEISCTFPDGVLPMRYVGRILVDPYCFKGRTLTSLVKEKLPAGRRIHVQTRPCVSGRLPMYEELAHLICGGVATIQDICGTSQGTSAVHTWATELHSDDLLCQMFENFADYLRQGTLEPLM